MTSFWLCGYGPPWQDRALANIENDIVAKIKEGIIKQLKYSKTIPISIETPCWLNWFVQSMAAGAFWRKQSYLAVAEAPTDPNAKVGHVNTIFRIPISTRKEGNFHFGLFFSLSV